tara:strand:- start:42759 stop:44543 length:1785 start_codon:yes stop_codon:yes gene_type:complete
MNKLLMILPFLLLFTTGTAQCVIDYNYYPVGANYGLDPDTLPDAYIGQFYDQDMTFFLPLDTNISGVNVTFEDYHITSISLPLGLTWECNNASLSCHYDPTVSQYGCVKISGNALMPGYYDVEVNLVATHSLSALTGTENISFTLPFSVIPDTSSSTNAGFAMTNANGCYPVTVSFTNNNTGMLSYYWDFGNGSSSTMAQPAAQIYNQPGDYIVEYFAVQTNATYFLESIEVVSGSCADGGLYGDPDFFYTVSTPSGILEEVTSGNYITQNFPLTINSFSPLELTGQSVSISLYDNDDIPFFPSTEDCGSFTFTPVQQAGTFSVNGGGLSLNYTVMEVPANIISSSDTIHVYDYPAPANLTYDTLNNIIFTYSDTIAMQWYYYNSPIPGATDTFLNPTVSGLYSLLLVNDYGCGSSSSQVSVVICDSSYQPLIDDNGSTAWMLDSALYSNLQWYSVSTGIINGANQSFFPATESGEYYIVATDTFGCQYSSVSVLLSPFVSINEIAYENLITVGPNPLVNTTSLNVYLKNIEFSNTTFILRDIYGRELASKMVKDKFSFYRLSFEEFSNLSNGVYYLDIIYNNTRIRKKLVKLD